MLTRDGVRAGAFGIADQVLLSATNLAVGLILARSLAPSTFGVYVIGFAVMLAGQSAQVSLVTDPLLILAPRREGSAQSRYLAALLWVQVVVAVAAGAAIALVGETLWVAWGDGSEIPRTLAAVAAATVPVQLQAFCRAVLFARLRAAAVFWNDLLYCLLRLAGVAMLVGLGRLTVDDVFLVFGAAGSAATVCGLALCANVLRSRGESLGRTWAEHWDYGRWMLATSGAFWLSGQAPALLASSLLTPVAAAVIKACQYLVAPLSVAFTGLDGVLAPRASAAREASGEAALARFLRTTMLAFGGAAILYAALLLPLAPSLLSSFYAGRYSGYVPVVAVLLLDATLAGLARAPILRLKVEGQTRLIFHGYAWAAAAGLITLLVLARPLGILGAALAAPASSAALLAYLAARARAARGSLPSLAAPGARIVVPEP